MDRPGCAPGLHVGLEVGGHCSACGSRVDDPDRRWLGLLAIVVSTLLVAGVIGGAVWWLFAR